VVFKVDRRMIPEEDPAQVEASLRATIAAAAASFDPPRGRKTIQVEVKRMLLARAMAPLPGNKPLVEALQRTAKRCSARRSRRWARRCTPTCACTPRPASPASSTAPVPRTVLESNAKRADERLALDDLRRATKVVARTLLDLLGTS
jgi:succinyl-diaminopimelate desuccinylase